MDKLEYEYKKGVSDVLLCNDLLEVHHKKDIIQSIM